MPVRVWSTFTVGASHARMNRLHVGKLRTSATYALLPRCAAAKNHQVQDDARIYYTPPPIPPAPSTPRPRPCNPTAPNPPPRPPTSRTAPAQERARAIGTASSR
ncbi:hypothetical protein GCM10009735_34080 [Actinomadura chokoriensis]